MLFNKHKFKVNYKGLNDPVTAVMAAVQVASYVGQSRAADKAAAASQQQATAQKEGIAAQGRVAAVEAQRQRVAQVREARIRRATIEASAGNTGLGFSSSGIAGGSSSVSSQEGANIGAIGQTQTFAGEASAANQRSADAGAAVSQAQANGQQWQAIGSVAGDIFKSKGGWTTIFGGNTNIKAGT